MGVLHHAASRNYWHKFMLIFGIENTYPLGRTRWVSASKLPEAFPRNNADGSNPSMSTNFREAKSPKGDEPKSGCRDESRVKLKFTPMVVPDLFGAKCTERQRQPRMARIL